jgi:hypothetical protein
MPVVTDKLVTPPVVRKYVDSLAGQPDYPPEVLAEIEQTLNLSYHHGGGYMWSRGHGADLEVLFAGTGDETADWWHAQEPEVATSVSLAYIPPWKQTKRELGLHD